MQIHGTQRSQNDPQKESAKLDYLVFPVSKLTIELQFLRQYDTGIRFNISMECNLESMSKLIPQWSTEFRQ